MPSCPNTHPSKGIACERENPNHPRCTGFDEDIDDFIDWPNPDYVAPSNTTEKAAKSTLRRAIAETPPDVRVDGIEAGMAASQAAADARWSDAERAQVLDAVRRLCRARPGGTFSADDVWDALAGAVPVTKGLAAVLQAVKREGLCEPTDEHTTARRGGAHDHGQTLRVWASLVKRIPDRAY